jgi:phosphoenolpyruvate-protein kinase (PTS system EI component)
MSHSNSQIGWSHEGGLPVVEGIAIGLALIWASDPVPRRVAGTVQQERARLARAIARATRGVKELARLLPPAEAELFAPELPILDELGPQMLARVDAGGASEQAVEEATAGVATDLVMDARARLLDGLAHDERSVESHLDGRDGERVLVTQCLTPSVVASLPARIVGIVAASEDPSRRGAADTSHAAILARGRDIPLVFVPPPVADRIVEDDPLVLDTTVSPAHLWVAAAHPLVEAAHARREAWVLRRAEDETEVTAPLTHLGLEVHVNVGSLHERIPSSAEGIGLVRTELVFSDRSSPPSEAEQFGALRAIASRLQGAPVVVRLFDAGGDKPLAWLGAPEGAEAARGIELLLMYPAILDTQLRATLRAAERADVRVLLPLVTSAGDVERIRARTRRKIPVGAMVETPGAVDRIDSVAAASDFICIGTNDLFALVAGQDRADATLSLDARALRMIQRVVDVSHARARRVSVCGEIAGDPHSARILVGLGVDALSVATARLARLKVSLRGVTLDDCRQLAGEALR